MEFMHKIAVPWNDTVIKDRDYNPLAAAAVIEYAEVFGEPQNTSLTSWQTVNGILQKGFGMTKPKRDKTVKALINTGMFVETKDGVLAKTTHRKEKQKGLEMFTDDNQFVSLSCDWLNYCWEAFGKDCMSAKTLFFMNKMGTWMRKDGGPSEVKISITGRWGLLAKFGYNSGSGAGKEKMSQIIDRLNEDGIIVLSAPQTQRNEWGYTGVYRYLLGICDKVPFEEHKPQTLVSFDSDVWPQLAKELFDRGISFKKVWG